jgi:hypothetical protein
MAFVETNIKVVLGFRNFVTYKGFGEVFEGEISAHVDGGTIYTFKCAERD